MRFHILTYAGVLRESADRSKIYDAESSQPLVTATQVALVNLLNGWSIIPTAVVGHSSGTAPDLRKPLHPRN